MHVISSSAGTKAAKPPPPVEPGRKHLPLISGNVLLHTPEKLGMLTGVDFCGGGPYIGGRKKTGLLRFKSCKLHEQANMRLSG